ncbi:TonB-dependent receptor [Sphingobacterium deserti]|nr:TonB-dependent receptor [Sphingobacterium deserti]
MPIRNLSKALLFISFLLTHVAFSQTGLHIHGRVTARGNAVAGATVVVGLSSQQADSLGRFQFSNLKSGEYVVLATALGYAEFRDTVLLSDKDKSINIELATTNSRIDEVHVTGQSATQQVREQPIRAVVIDTRAVAQQPATLAEVMNRAPGIRIRQSGGLGNAVDVSINGFQGNAVQYFRDGIPLEYLGGGYGINNVPLNLLERVEVYKGVVPVSIGGDALGGAVNLVSAQHSGTQVNASYEIASFNTHIANLSLYHTDKKDRLFFGIDAFYNYSDNNYKADVEVANASANYDTVNVELFHNRYKHHFTEVYFGLKNRFWADEIRFSFAGYGIDRQSQHPALMTNPYGAVTLKNQGLVPAVRYRKKLWNDKLSIDQFISHSFTRRNRTDTLRGTYDWYGNFTPRNNDDIGESPNPSLSEIDYTQTLSRTNLAIRINDRHMLEGNMVYNRSSRVGADPYGFRFAGTEVDILSKEATYSKLITGLSWDSKWLDGKLTNQLFVKYFNFRSEGINAFLSNDTDLSKFTTATDNNWGIGNALKYQINARSFARASAELTNRLPLAEELFGNNDTRAPNFSLKPERSFNLNVGYRYSTNKMTAELGAFYRKTSGMIMLVPIQPPFSQFQNLDSIRGYGFDIDLTYQAHRHLELNGNVTWQDNRMVDVGSAVYKWTEGTRQRNTPYFFANLGATGLFHDVFTTKDLLKPYVHYNFIREFYLVPIPRDQEPQSFLGIFGNAEVPIKDLVPNQSLISAGFNYVFPSSNFILGAEVKNIANAKLYDYYKIQRPGRSFHLKLTYFIKSIKHQ